MPKLGNPYALGSTIESEVSRSAWPAFAKEVEQLERDFEIDSEKLIRANDLPTWENRIVMAGAFAFVRPKKNAVFVPGLAFGLTTPFLASLPASVGPTTHLGFSVASLGFIAMVDQMRRVGINPLGAKAAAFLYFDTKHRPKVSAVLGKDKHGELERYVRETETDCRNSARLLVAGAAAYGTLGAAHLDGFARAYPAYEKARAQWMGRLRKVAGWL
jgi:hypothetical protein